MLVEIIYDSSLTSRYLNVAVIGRFFKRFLILLLVINMVEAGFFLPLLFALLKLFLGFVLTVISIYAAITLFDRLTRDIDEKKEIKKGNVATGMLLAAAVLAVLLITQPGIAAFLTIVGAQRTSILLLAVGIADFLIAFLTAVFSVYFAIRFLDILTVDVNEVAELKKGNLAIGAVMAAVMIGIALIIKEIIPSVLMTFNVIILGQI